MKKKVQEALEELLNLKELSERIDRLEFESIEALREAQAEYKRRKPRAWSAAKEAMR